MTRLTRLQEESSIHVIQQGDNRYPASLADRLEADASSWGGLGSDPKFPERRHYVIVVARCLWFKEREPVPDYFVPMNPRMAYHGANMKTLHRVKGISHDLIITQQGNTLTLWSGSGIRHTVLDLDAPQRPGLEYARNTLLALAFSPEAESILLLGLGGGSMYHMLRRTCPLATIEAVEIDPAVVDLARRYFQISLTNNFIIHLGDAADYVSSTQKSYNIVILDAYLGDTMEDRLTTQEFFSNVSQRLRLGGVLVVNWVPGNAQRLRKTIEVLEETVGKVWTLAGYHSHNCLLFATARKITHKFLVEEAGKIEAHAPDTRSVARLVRYLRTA
jgi:spermidine synthase